MSNFFGTEFYPTPIAVIDRMLEGYSVKNKIILEPSAGKGNIVDYCKTNGAADVLACELHKDLQAILATKCNILTPDFLQLTSERVSHIQAIIMNPPFSSAGKHILHAWEIAPPGCTIISLCNYETLNNRYYSVRKELGAVIEEYGYSNDLGNCFDTAERETDVRVSVVRLQKPGANEKSDFNGFFLEDDEPEVHANAIMPYNAIRDLVQRYINAVRIYDKQLEIGVQMNALTSTFYSSSLAFSCTIDNKPKLRNDYKKDLQKAGWNFVFNKMNIRKHTTQGLKEDINRFVEQQVNIPFTMRNIYHMLDIIHQTTSQRMDKALEEVFDKMTRHYDENRYCLEGWKTNSHYLLNEKFINPWITEVSYRGGMDIRYGAADQVEDFVKALCYISGMNYDECTPLSTFVRTIRCEFGQWYSWGFFEIKGFKKGTMHFKFQNQDLWAKFNQNIARIKGFPLPESVRK